MNLFFSYLYSMSTIILKTANKKTSVSKLKIRAAVGSAYSKSSLPASVKSSEKVVILNTQSSSKISPRI